MTEPSTPLDQLDANGVRVRISGAQIMLLLQQQQLTVQQLATITGSLVDLRTTVIGLCEAQDKKAEDLEKGYHALELKTATLETKTNALAVFQTTLTMISSILAAWFGGRTKP